LLEDRDVFFLNGLTVGGDNDQLIGSERFGRTQTDEQREYLQAHDNTFPGLNDMIQIHGRLRALHCT
jgi:hypothetical protein